LDGTFIVHSCHEPSGAHTPESQALPVQLAPSPPPLSPPPLPLSALGGWQMPSMQSSLGEQMFPQRPQL
jgi:hypothetical protein